MATGPRRRNEAANVAESFSDMSHEQVILYAEDEETDAFFVERAFKQAGINERIMVVPSGKAAIEYLSGGGEYADRTRHPLPCLVLLDLNMPGLSGLEVLKWIRSTPGICTLVVLMLTSSNQDADIHSAYTQGANGYLVKPGDIGAIIPMARAIKDYWLTQNRTTGPGTPGSIP
jgi:CheY-like chemotaxis protein